MAMAQQGIVGVVIMVEVLEARVDFEIFFGIILQVENAIEDWGYRKLGV
jgi:hypothetical protein